MIYLRMGYIYKILAKKFCLIISLQIYKSTALFGKTNMVPKYRSARDSGVTSATGNSYLQSLHELRFEYPKILLCGYLNIHDLRVIIHDVPLDYFVISETKLDNSFPNAQLTINIDEI